MRSSSMLVKYFNLLILYLKSYKDLSRVYLKYNLYFLLCYIRSNFSFQHRRYDSRDTFLRKEKDIFWLKLAVQRLYRDLLQLGKFPSQRQKSRVSPHTLYCMINSKNCITYVPHNIFKPIYCFIFAIIYCMKYIESLYLHTLSLPMCESICMIVYFLHCLLNIVG